MRSARKVLAQRVRRSEQASGEFVRLPFNPAVFDLGNGGDVVEPFCGGGVLQASVDIAVQDEMAEFVGDGEAHAVFEARTHKSAFVQEDGAQVAHKQGLDVELLAQTVHGNEVEAEIELGK